MQRKTTRRHFLQSAAAVATAPFILPSGIWAAEKRTRPNERITLGFIGTGKQARGLLNGFLRREETQVLAVCDVDKTRREHSQQIVNKFYSEQKNSGTYKGCEVYNDFRELLSRNDIDAVVIATPDHWHAIPVLRAAQAKKDIYCEKPLSYTIHEAKAMMDAVRANDCVFQTGSQQRSSKGFRTACELVRNGRLGKIERVEVGVGGPSKWCDLPEGMPPEGLDWDFWLGPAPERGWNEVLSPVGVHDHFPAWRNYREYSGGGMTDWGAHHFDIAQWGLGMDESGPVEIVPPADPAAGRGVRFTYANGVEMEHVDGNGITFFGSAGKLLVNRSTLEVTPEAISREPLGPKNVQLYKSEDHLGDWLRCIRTRAMPICDVEIGARSVTVCHLGNLAYWHNRRMEWDPVNWKFAGGTGKEEWLDTERRSPWKLKAD